MWTVGSSSWNCVWGLGQALVAFVLAIWLIVTWISEHLLNVTQQLACLDLAHW